MYSVLAERQATARRSRSLRRMSLVAALLVVVQVGLGTGVNLYVAVPRGHPGSTGADYFTRSARSVGWAVGQGTLTLAAHAALGLLLVVMALVLAVRALTAHAGAAGGLCVAAAALVIGAAFNGASFLDFGDALSSLLMALLGLGALVCYVLAAYSLGAGR